MSHLLDAISGVPNACEPIHGIVTGGQPAPEHLAALKRAGCAVVIDLREAREPRPFKTPAAVVQAGLEYRSIPVGHGAVSDATFARLVDAVRELAGKRPAFVHCSSGNRVGAGLIPYFMLEQGLEEQEAVAQAMRVGLRDRKSTRLNSSHGYISYAVFCLKKKNKQSLLPKNLFRIHMIRNFGVKLLTVNTLSTAL